MRERERLAKKCELFCGSTSEKFESEWKEEAGMWKTDRQKERERWMWEEGELRVECVSECVGACALASFRRLRACMGVGEPNARVRDRGSRMSERGCGNPRGPHWLLNYKWMERKGCCLATLVRRDKTKWRDDREREREREREWERSSPHAFWRRVPTAAVTAVAEPCQTPLRSSWIRSSTPIRASGITESLALYSM